MLPRCQRDAGEGRRGGCCGGKRRAEENKSQWGVRVRPERQQGALDHHHRQIVISEMVDECV